MAPAAALRIVDEDATGFRSGPAVRMQGDDEDAEDADEGTETPLDCLLSHVALTRVALLTTMLATAALKFLMV